jgi:hypothetical protein
MRISSRNGLPLKSSQTTAPGNWPRITAALEKKLHLELRFLQAKYPQAEIEVGAMDEHRY